jgi:hypothetical protein
MARSKDIFAVASPIVIVGLAALMGVRPPKQAEKPKPDKVLMVCSYATPDDRTFTFVASGHDCGICRGHLPADSAGRGPLAFTGCYRQIEKGEPAKDRPDDEADPAWTEAESEASHCDVLLASRVSASCEQLRSLSFSCRRQCHRDPDCLTMCRDRCDTGGCQNTSHKGSGTFGPTGKTAIASKN